MGRGHPSEIGQEFIDLSATLTLSGNGPVESWLQHAAKRFGVANAVEFVFHLPRQQRVDSFLSCTALFFPSLHDQGSWFCFRNSLKFA
jgi:hypothetical protein